MSESLIATEELDKPEPVARTLITADEALERLRNGQPVENAKIDRLQFRGEFAHPVRLKNCLLIRPNFHKVTFHGEVAIVGSSIDRPTFRGPAVFEHGLALANSTLNYASIQDVDIHGVFNAGDMVVRGPLRMIRCHFFNQARFWGTKASDWVDFKDCVFDAEADFRSMHCDEGLIFKECQFQANFLLRGTTVHKKLELNSSRFEGVIDLSKAKLHDFVYLEEIIAGTKQRWAFHNTVAERILIQPEQIVDRLESELQGQYTTAMQEYGLLKQSYQNLHRFDQEDWAFYRFKVSQRRGVGRSWSRPWTKFNQFCNWLLLDLGCGYGTNPRRAVVTALVIIGFFAAIYMSEVNLLRVDKPPFDMPKEAWQNRVMIGMTVSVTVFTSGLSSIRDLAQGWMNIPLLIESLLGTLLWGLFVVAFSRKVIR